MADYRSSPLTGADYVSEAVYRLEQERVFRRYWLFAGFLAQLDVDGAFIARFLAGTPVVVQNFDGELRAFINRCAHRQMPLQSEPSGQRALVCPYHGWSYDREGVARIPGGGSSPTRLQRVALKQVGAFVFVNLAEKPPAIEQQLDESLLASLEQVSASFDHEVASSVAPAGHNWKLGFENVLDPGHVHYLHAKTFGRDVPPPGADTRRPARSLADLSFHQASPFSLKPADWHGYVTPFEPPPRYHNWFLYPNVNFVSVGGYSFSLHQFNPVCASETGILMVQFLARRSREMYFSPAVLWHNIQAEKRILDEDIVALERLQAGLGDNVQSAALGPLDARVADFVAWQARLLREPA